MVIQRDPHLPDVEWCVHQGTRYWRYLQAGWVRLNPELFPATDSLLAEATPERVVLWATLMLEQAA